MPKITVNGEIQQIAEPISLDQLIRSNNVEQPEMVSVQLNDEFVDRDDWAQTTAGDGDNVDFLYFMGGGC